MIISILERVYGSNDFIFVVLVISMGVVDCNAEINLSIIILNHNIVDNVLGATAVRNLVKVEKPNLIKYLHVGRIYACFDLTSIVTSSIQRAIQLSQRNKFIKIFHAAIAAASISEKKEHIFSDSNFENGSISLSKHLFR